MIKNFVAVFAIFTVCLTPMAWAIVGGSVVPGLDFKSNAMVRSTVAVEWTEPASGRDISCTGTLIDRDLVLTAAHCLIDVKQASDSQVYLLTPSVQEFGLPQILAKKFNTGFSKDIRQFFLSSCPKIIKPVRILTISSP